MVEADHGRGNRFAACAAALPNSTGVSAAVKPAAAVRYFPVAVAVPTAIVDVPSETDGVMTPFRNVSPTCGYATTIVSAVIFGLAYLAFSRGWITLIDTPGTNDPFLVRDEITRLSLASADIYIVVLTAQMPLSATDVALLRILRGLHKDRLIVFINRIDQLRNPAGDCLRLVAHVRAMLDQEFPAMDIPIIAGSAWWGSCASSDVQADLDRAANEALRAYAASIRQESLRQEKLAGPAFGAGPSSDVRESLRLCSGMPSVLWAIDQLMMRGSDAYVIQQLTAFFLELSRSAEIAALAEVRANERMAEQEIPALGGTPAASLQQWQDEFEQLNRAAQHVEEVIGVFQTTLDKTVNQGIMELQNNLMACVAGFTEFQLAGLADAYHEQSQRIWMADATPLREDFEHAYLYAVPQLSARLRNVEAIVRDHLASLLKEGVLEGLIEVGPAHIPAPSPVPNLGALSTVLSLDLDQPWWKAWLVQRPTLESRRVELKRLIETECASMARELVATADRSMQDQATTMTRQITAVTLDVVNSMRRRSMALVPNLQAGGPQGSTTDSETRASRQQGVEDARARLAAWQRSRTRLASLSARCDRLIRDHAPPLLR